MKSRKMMPVRVHALVLAAALASAAVVAAQTPAPAAPRAMKSGADVPRTADGRPNLEGIWDFRTITPMERPGNLGDKTVLDDREAAEFEVKNRRNQDTREKRSLGS